MIPEGMYRELLDCVLRPDGLERLLELAAQCLGNPVILTDTTYRLLGLTRDTPVEDAAWQELQNHGASSPELVRRFSEEGITARCLASEAPCLVDSGLAAAIPRAIVQVRLRQQAVAFLAVFAVGRPIDAAALADLARLGRVVAVVLERDRRVSSLTENLDENLLSDILSGQIRDRESLSDRLEAARFRLTPPYQLWALRHADTVLTEYYSRQLREQVPAACVFSLRERLLLLRSADPQRDAAFSAWLGDFCRGARLSGGVSLPFYDLMALPGALAQCLTARELAGGAEAEPTAFYRDYVLRHMLRRELDGGDYRPYLCPGMEALLAYDRENRSNYGEMLRYYLFHERGLAETAAAFFLHRNTVLKRLKTIAALTGWELEDANTRFRVLSSLIVLSICRVLPDTPELPFR